MSNLNFKINKNDANRFGLGFVWDGFSHFGTTMEQLVAREMLLLQEKSENNNIKILFFKGLAEKRDTYDNFGINRIQHDIDMLVSVENIYEFCDICNGIGYCIDLECRKITYEWVAEILMKSNGHHLPMLYKKLLGGSFVIGLEVHLMVDLSWKVSANDIMHSNDMLARRCLIGDTFPIYTFDIYDRLIVSLHHFSKHFLENFLTFYYCPQNQLFNCKSLLDAYLILKKYGDTISEDIILNRAKYYGFAEYVRFAVKMITEIFILSEQENHIFKTILNEPYLNYINSSKSFFANQTLYYSSISLNNIIEKSNLFFYKEAVKYCLQSNRTVIAQYGDFVDLPLTSTNNIVPSKNSATIFWDDNILEFSVSLHKCFSNKRNNKRQDGISIRIYNPLFDFENDNAVRNIFICFDKTNNGYEPNVSFNGADSFSLGTIRLSNQWVSYSHNLQSLTISIPWKELKISISDISYIGLEFMICTDLENIATEIDYFSNHLFPHYNPAKFGIIQLLRQQL